LPQLDRQEVMSQIGAGTGNKLDGIFHSRAVGGLCLAAWVDLCERRGGCDPDSACGRNGTGVVEAARADLECSRSLAGASGGAGPAGLKNLACGRSNVVFCRWRLRGPGGWSGQTSLRNDSDVHLSGEGRGCAPLAFGRPGLRRKNWRTLKIGTSTPRHAPQEPDEGLGGSIPPPVGGVRTEGSDFEGVVHYHCREPRSCPKAGYLQPDCRWWGGSGGSSEGREIRAHRAVWQTAGKAGGEAEKARGDVNQGAPVVAQSSGCPSPKGRSDRRRHYGRAGIAFALAGPTITGSRTASSKLPTKRPGREQSKEFRDRGTPTLIRSRRIAACGRWRFISKLFCGQGHPREGRKKEVLRKETPGGSD